MFKEQVISKYSILERPAAIKALRDIYQKNKEKIDSLHKERELIFTAMPIFDFNRAASYKIHKSPTYDRKQSSEYRLIFIGDDVAYARKSNHWGRFSTNVYETDPDAKVLFPNAEPDSYGRLGWREFNWRLVGGNEKAAKSQAGYILLKSI